jgi:hypothetical protein
VTNRRPASFARRTVRRGFCLSNVRGKALCNQEIHDGALPPRGGRRPSRPASSPLPKAPDAAAHRRQDGLVIGLSTEDSTEKILGIQKGSAVAQPPRRDG